MLGCGHADEKYRGEPIEADWLPGMSVLVPIEVFQRGIRVDQEAFPQYSGDADFTLRAKKAGFPLIVYPSSIIYNKVRHSGVVSKLLLGVEPFSFKLLRECLTSIKSSAAFNTFGRLILRHAPVWAWPLTLGRFYGFFFLKVLQVALKLPGPRRVFGRRRKPVQSEGTTPRSTEPISELSGKN
jgi:GT2 family glycosyltransferase